MVAELASVVNVAGSADHSPVVHDQQLGVDVQLFLDPIVYFFFRLSVPPFFRDGALSRHRVVRHTEGRRVLLLLFLFRSRGGVESPLGLGILLGDVGFPAVLRIRGQISPGSARLRGPGAHVAISAVLRVLNAVDALLHHLLRLRTLDFLILDARLFLLLLDLRGLVQAVVAPQVEDEDVLGRVDALLADLLKDAVLAPADGLVLVVHDRPGADRGVVSQVPGKPGDGGDDEDYAELAALLPGPHHRVDDGAADGVVDRALLVARGRDEKLVLNVHVMLGAPYDLAVGVLDGVLGQDAARPVGAGADYLRVDAAAVVEVLGREGRYGVHDVFPHGVAWTLDADQILVHTLAAAELQPVKLVVALVLVTLDKVPAQDEMLGDVVDARPDHAHSDVVPWHTTVVGLAQLVLLPILHVLEVHHPVVVEVLAGPDLVGNSLGMDVG